MYGNHGDLFQVYFVHSYCALPTEASWEWTLTTTDYGSQRFISSVQRGNILATQFHPEKSGPTGLRFIDSFLSRNGLVANREDKLLIGSLNEFSSLSRTTLVKRIIACLDVRSNDSGDLVVTKGDQYDVREESSSGRGQVRNLGKPVALCKRYYDDGADEVNG